MLPIGQVAEQGGDPIGRKGVVGDRPIGPIEAGGDVEADPIGPIAPRLLQLDRVDGGLVGSGVGPDPCVLGACDRASELPSECRFDLTDLAVT